IVYFISTEVSPLERHLYSIGLNGRSKSKMSEAEGIHEINFSGDFKYFIKYHSSRENPLRVSLHAAPKGNQLKVLEENKELEANMDLYSWSHKEFLTFESEDGAELNAYIIKPLDFDEGKKYPLLMYVYGGPGSQEVMNSWGGSRELWFQYLAQQGYI